MNAVVAQLYDEYLQRTGEIAAAASLTLADVMQSNAGRAEATPPGQPFTVIEAARRLGVSTKTIYRLIQGGQLHSFRIGRNLRVSPGDLSDYTARRDVLSTELDVRPARKPRRP
jgi:excisionase family DNA binding protein